MSAATVGEILIVESPVGVGKSTVCASLLKYHTELFGKHVKVDMILEHVDGMMLDAFLGDQKRYAFDFQIYMARNRIETMRTAEKLAREGHIVIIDRGLPGDFTFAMMHRDIGNFSELEWAIYCSVMRDVFPQYLPLSLASTSSATALAPKTDGHMRQTKILSSYVQAKLAPVRTRTVYLKTSAETAFKRMRARGNEGEIASYTLEYFQAMSDAHDTVMTHMTDVKQIDFETELSVEPNSRHYSLADTRAIWKKIEQK